MKPTDCVLVHTLWQGTGDVHAARCGLRVTDPRPVYFYQQHGRTKVSREPLHRVEFWCNEGRETGVARRRELIAAGYGGAAMRKVRRPRASHQGVEERQEHHNGGRVLLRSL